MAESNDNLNIHNTYSLLFIFYSDFVDLHFVNQ